MKPRVLFLSPQPFFQWRGSPIRVDYNLRALSELGFEVDLVTLPFGEDRSIAGVTLHRVKNIPGLRDLPIGPSFGKLLFDAKIFLRALRLLRHNRYEVVHGVEDAGFLGVFLARRHRCLLVYEKHSDPASYRKKGLRNLVMAAYARVEAFTMRHADAVIATGPGLAEAVRRLCPGTPCHHIPDIPSSLAEADPGRVQALRASFRKDEKEVLALYVGSFAVYQGIDLLFAAIPEAIRREPRLRVLVIGGTEGEIAQRRAFLEKEGAAESVTFLGKMAPDELPSSLAAVDILLSPRISGNNTPLKLLDYLKAGRAILATDVEANRLLLDEGNAAFAPPEAGAFAEALAALAGSAEERARLARGGRHLIDTHYNFRVYRDGIAKVYRGVERG